MLFVTERGAFTMRNLEHDRVWNESRSIKLSRVLVLLFFIALLACDIGGWWLVQFICEMLVHRNHGLAGGYVLLACLYLCSVPAYLLLYDMNRLLRNIQAARVFLPANVRLLRRISWCCFAAALICLVGAPVWYSLLIVTVAAAFVGLIVRIVKNVFEQAILMKDELDYTV